MTFDMLKSPFKLLHRKTRKEQYPLTWSMRILCAQTYPVVSGGCSRPERRMAKVCAFFCSFVKLVLAVRREKLVLT